MSANDLIDEETNLAIIPLNFSDKESLYKAYMPFVNQGGLFIATKTPSEYGAEVILLVSLFDEPDKLAVKGKVVWVTPAGAAGGRQEGMGVQFTSDSSKALCHKIETYLAGMSDNRDTLTL